MFTQETLLNGEKNLHLLHNNSGAPFEALNHRSARPSVIVGLFMKSEIHLNLKVELI